ncbi:MAG: DUF2214 family protein [Fibrobacterota bacterium]|nr:DUF2214 family protein [Fibrobacterota bacterium]QQS05661.1 MAG: DUF2214 family protein [Fibrobacterota bacterium]
MNPMLRAFFVSALEGVSTIGFATITGALFGRGFCLRRLMTVREARMVRLTDSLFWLGASLMIVPQMTARIIGTRTATGPALWIQVAAMLGLLAVEAWPSRVFRSWDRYLDMDQLPFHTDRINDRLILLWKIQLVVLAILAVVDPLLAATIFAHP